MKRSRLAAEDEIAHDRIVAAFKALLGEDHERVQALDGLKGIRMPTDVRAMEEKKIMADVLEGIAENRAGNKAGAYPSEPLDENLVQILADAGYDTLEKIRNASDEELLEIDGIGPKSLEKIRQAVG
jgi:DNA uptake protein ComE-like DNA-binding protein